MFERHDGGHCYIRAKIVTDPVTKAEFVQISRWPERPSFDDVVAFGKWAELKLLTIDDLAKHSIYIEVTTHEAHYRQWYIRRPDLLHWSGEKWEGFNGFHVRIGTLAKLTFDTHQQALDYVNTHRERILT